jgi:hypothetical protein
MPILIGVACALAAGAFGTFTGLDRERAFYPTTLVVVASYYILFAVMGGSMHALWPELLVFGAFAALAAVGFRRDLRLVMLGLLAHGIMDVFHGGFIANSGVPDWWPAWCSAYDVAAPIYLAIIVWRGRVPMRPAVRASSGQPLRSTR